MIENGWDYYNSQLFACLFVVVFGGDSSLLSPWLWLIFFFSLFNETIKQVLKFSWLWLWNMDSSIRNLYCSLQHVLLAMSIHKERFTNVCRTLLLYSRGSQMQASSFTPLLKWCMIESEAGGGKKKKKEAPLTSFNEHQHKTEHSNYVKGKKKSWEPVRRHASTGHLLQRKMPIRSEFLILELLVRHNDKWWSHIRCCHRVPHFGVTGQAQWQVMVTYMTLSHIGQTMPDHVNNAKTLWPNNVMTHWLTVPRHFG